MKEIEIKAKLKDREMIVAKLKALGCEIEKRITQQDTVYAENLGSIEIFRTNRAFLRLRVKNGEKIIFTVKKRLLNGLDALEHEVEVSDREEMEKAILLMGYQKACSLQKTREITHYNGCEICLDEVEGLGSFIEMEKLVKLSEDVSSLKVQEELFEFFMSLGIQKEDRVFDGYDILVMRKNEI